jgi:hypothetical protein
LITLLHTYYPPNQTTELLDLKNVIWTHAKYWNSEWDIDFPSGRYLIPNKGKDIGGKLFSFKVLLERNCKDDFVLLLHDKQSPQVIDGERWKKELWLISEQAQINKAMKLFEKNKNIGIVASKTSIVDPEKTGDVYAYAKNKELIFAEATKYGIVPENKSFVAGTMFIARLQPFLDFFKLNDPLLIRSKFEDGNVLDLQSATYTHSWERLLSWIITSKGYRIEGL